MNTLMMFMDPSGDIDDHAIEVIRSYDASAVTCIVYSSTQDTVGTLESAMPDCSIDRLEVDGPEDMDLLSAIKASVFGAQGRICIDVTFASPYHAAVCMDLGGSDKTEIYYSRICAPGEIMHERLDRIRYYFGDLPGTYYEVLDSLDQVPRMAERIVTDLEGIRSQSTVYAALSDLHRRGLIEKTSGQVPEGYSSRVPNFYRLNPDQQWDYDSYKRLDRRRSDERHRAEFKHKVSQETKRNSLKSRRTPGRKSV